MTVDLQKHCMKYLIARDIKGEGVMKFNTSLSIAFYAQSCISSLFFPAAQICSNSRRVFDVVRICFRDWEHGQGWQVPLWNEQVSFMVLSDIKHHHFFSLSLLLLLLLLSHFSGLTLPWKNPVVLKPCQWSCNHIATKKDINDVHVTSWVHPNDLCH